MGGRRKASAPWKSCGAKSPAGGCFTAQMRRWFSFPTLTINGTETLSRRACKAPIASSVWPVQLEFALAIEEIIEVVRILSSPGILILDLSNKLLYSNQEALSLLKNLNDIPSEVRRLCDEVKVRANRRGFGSPSNANCALLWRQRESPCSLRAFLVGARSNGRPATHLMVLVEKLTDQRGLSKDILQAQHC